MDHLRGKFYLSGDDLKPKGPFKLTNVIASMTDFILKIDSIWSESAPLFHSTSALFSLSKKPLIRQMGRNNLFDHREEQQRLMVIYAHVKLII